jgi:hypothetical protein
MALNLLCSLVVSLQLLYQHLQNLTSKSQVNDPRLFTSSVIQGHNPSLLRFHCFYDN